MPFIDDAHSAGRRASLRHTYKSFWRIHFDSAWCRRTTLEKPFGRYRLLRLPFGKKPESGNLPESDARDTAVTESHIRRR